MRGTATGSSAAVTLALAACALLAGAGEARAQSIFKYVYPDGRVIYTDKPVPGAKLEDELEAPPPPVPTVQPSSGTTDFGRAADQRAKSLDQAWAEMKEWGAKLDRAKADLEAGREPREGERIGTSEGKSRMSDQYWERQRANEATVKIAEERMRQAQDTINALR